MPVFFGGLRAFAFLAGARLAGTFLVAALATGRLAFLTERFAAAAFFATFLPAFFFTAFFPGLRRVFVFLALVPAGFCARSGFHARKDFAQFTFTLDDAQQPQLPVVFDQRLRLRCIDFQSIGNDLFLVIGPLIQLGMVRAGVAPGRSARWRKRNIEYTPAGPADASSREALDQCLPADVHEEDGVKRSTEFDQHRVQRIRLVAVARKAIEDESGLGVPGPKPFPDQPQNDVVRDQCARIHRRLGLEAEVGTPGDSIPQQIT